MSLELVKSRRAHRANKSKPLKDISALDMAYMAGIVDGEGCISITKTNLLASNRNRLPFSYRGYLTVSNTHKPLLEWLVAVTGVGNIGRMNQVSERNKETWKWTVWSREAAALAAVLGPHLKIKGPQAKLLVDFIAAQRGPGWKNPGGLPRTVTDAELAFRERSYLSAKEMNRRGPIAA